MKKIANIVLNDFTNDSRVWKISNSLASYGYHPIVVALHNVGLSEKESVSGVDVERVKLITRPWVKWKPVQLLKYFEFVLRAFWRYRKVDYVHCNDLNALPVGLLIKLFGKDVKIVYDCHEYETEMDSLVGVEKKLKKIFERASINYVDHVITVSSSIAKEYSSLYGIEEPSVVLNCPPYSEKTKSNHFRESLGIRPDQKIFLYQGGLKSGRGIEVLVESFTGLDSDQNVLVFMGYGALENFVKEVSSCNENIYFHPAVPPSVLLDYTSSADYGVSFIEDSCLSYRYSLPNKIFEYLMSGLPVLTSNLFEMKNLVEAEGVGIVANENTVGGFRKAVLLSLEQDYKVVHENTLKARKKYCWEEQEKILLGAYEKL